MKEGNNNLGFVGAALVGSAVLGGAMAHAADTLRSGIVEAADKMSGPSSPAAALVAPNGPATKLGNAAAGIDSSLDTRNGRTMAKESAAVSAVVPPPVPPASPKVTGLAACPLPPRRLRSCLAAGAAAAAPAAGLPDLHAEPVDFSSSLAQPGRCILTRSTVTQCPVCGAEHKIGDPCSGGVSR